MAVATEVEFHTGVADKLDFTCRLLRKAFRRGARVAVTGPVPLLARLDAALWAFDERDFVPHVRWSAAATPQHAARTPIWLLDGAVPADPPPVLVHLGGALPTDLAPFARVIEVLSVDPDDEHEGRQRWRDYKAAGLPVAHHPAAVLRD